MSGYPLNNTNYNWERRPKKCKDGSGGGGDSEAFDAKKFGDDLMKYIYSDLPNSTVFPDMYYIEEQSDTTLLLGPPESDVEFAAIINRGILNKMIVPVYSSIPSDDKVIIGIQDFVLKPAVVENAQVEQVEIDGAVYYIFIIVSPIS